MRRRVLRLGALWIAATAALAVALDLGPHDRSLALAAYFDLVCTIALGGLAATIVSSLPGSRALNRGRRQAREPKPARPEQLASLERPLSGPERADFELPARVIALIHQIASASLARRRGTALEREPERAREIVGEHVWSLVADGGPSARPAVGSRLTLTELGIVVDDLEAI